MARRAATPPPPETPLELNVAREDARAKIQQQIQRGVGLHGTEIRTEGDLETIRSERTKWTSYTEELLSRLFTNGSPTSEFKRAVGPIYVNASTAQQVRSLKESIKLKLTVLESLVERIELMPVRTVAVMEPPESRIRPQPYTPPAAKKMPSRKIFVVHGHDNGARETICRFLEKLDLQPVVLHEQANRGMTIIEKIEAHSEVEFAVVILTADDIGASKTAPETAAPRQAERRAGARVLPRESWPRPRLRAVRKGRRSAVGFELAKELRAAGIEVDMNRL